MRLSIRSFLWFTLTAASTTISASAAIIEVQFSGYVTESSFPSAPVGSEFSGTAFYSTPASPFQIYEGQYFYALPLPIQVDINGSSVSSQNPTGNDHLEVTYPPVNFEEVSWLTGFYQMDITGPLAADRAPGFEVLSLGFGGPVSMLGGPELGSVFPGLNQWTQFATLDFSTNTMIGGSGPADKDLQGTITALDSFEIPEPSTFAMLFLVSLLAAVGSRLPKLRRH